MGHSKGQGNSSRSGSGKNQRGGNGCSRSVSHGEVRARRAGLVVNPHPNRARFLTTRSKAKALKHREEKFQDIAVDSESNPVKLHSLILLIIRTKRSKI